MGQRRSSRTQLAMKVEVGTKINGTPALIYVNDIPHDGGASAAR